MRWADQLIKLSNFELELLQARLADVMDRREGAEMKLAVLTAEGEAEIALARSDPEAGARRRMGAFNEGLKQRKGAVQRDIDTSGRRRDWGARRHRRSLRDAEEVRTGGRKRPRRRRQGNRPPRKRGPRRNRPEASGGSAVNFPSPLAGEGGRMEAVG